MQKLKISYMGISTHISQHKNNYFKINYPGIDHYGWETIGQAVEFFMSFIAERMAPKTTISNL